MEKEKKLNKYELQSLQPKNDIKSEVIDDIKKILLDGKYKNIAITGPYSSGKSSIINSTINELYNEKEPKEKQNKKAQNKDRKGRVKNNYKEKNKTIKISLAKLLKNNDVDEKELESTIVEKINNSCKKYIDKHNICFNSRASLLITMIISFMVWTNIYSKYVFWLKNYSWWLFLLRIIAWIIPVCFICFGLLSIINKILSLNIKLGDLNLELKLDRSTENPIMSNLSYIKRALTIAKVKFVVFEDLDRFNFPNIFDKLRDLNINLNENIDVIFIYEVRDDLFSASNKGKFFDIAIPIVPFVSYESSGEELRKMFKTTPINDSITYEFISNIAVYVNDVRILKNAFNNFCIYYNGLNIDSIDCQKLFSFMLYKELFPNDFYKLQSNEGILYNVFKSKKDFVNKTIIYYEDKISEFKNIISQNQDNENLITSCDIQITNYEKKLEKINYYKMFELFDNINEAWDDIVENNFEEIQKNGKTEISYINFLKNAIRKGLIAEDYNIYMNKFIEGSRTRKDNEFIIKVRDKNIVTSIEDEIDTPDVVIKLLDNIDLKNKNVLNINLSKSIMTMDNEKEKNYINTLITSDKYNEMLEKYFENTIEYRYFISKVLELDSMFFNNIKKVKNRDEIIIYVLENIKEDLIINNNSNSILVEYIEENSNILDKLKYEKINIIRILEIRVANIEKINNEKIISYIIDNNLFSINFDNIRYILNRNNINKDLIKNKNLTAILSDSKLSKYIINHFEIYINNVYNKLNNQKEDEDTISELINKNDIEKGLLVSVLNKQVSKINNANIILKKEDIEICLENNLLVSNISNILYCFEKEIDKDICVEYLNRNGIVVDEKNDRKHHELIKQLILTDNIEMSSVNELLKAKLFQKNKYTREEINDLLGSNNGLEKLNSIINSNNIDFDYNIIEILVNNVDNNAMESYFENNVNRIERKYNVIKELLPLSSKTTIIKAKNKKKDKYLFSNKLRIKVIEDLTNEESKMIDSNTAICIFNLQLENKFNINCDLFNRVFDSLKDRISKIRLINNNISIIDKDKMAILLDKLYDPYSRVIKNGKSPKLENNEDNKLLVDNISILGYNISYKEDNRYIHIKGNRNK